MHDSKFIWQTAKSLDLVTPESDFCMGSWRRLNSSWNYHFCSDTEIENLFRTFYPTDLLEIYLSLPLGIMKSQLFRYGVLYEFGGIYADIDTVCRVPIEDWMKNQISNMLTIGRDEDGGRFGDWIIASPPRHPVLMAALNLIKQRIADDGGIDRERENYVDYYTGCDMLTTVVNNYVGGIESDTTNHNQLFISDDLKILVYNNAHFDGDVVWHLNASYHWRHLPSGYLAWLEKSSKILNY